MKKIFLFLILLASFLTTVNAQQEKSLDNNKGLALIGAGLAIAGATIGAGIAISQVASSGLASIAEKKEMIPWVLILVGLAEGIAIYGFIISIIIMGKV